MYQIIFTFLIVIGLVFGSCSSPRHENSQPRLQTLSVPAIWLVKDADTNVYLFGTVHMLRPDIRWQTAEFYKAFNASDVIYQEVNLSEIKQREMAPLLRVLGYYNDGRTLRQVLNPFEEEKVLRTAAYTGISLRELDRMKPWFAAIKMQTLVRGFNSENGVEQVITRMARKSGKPLRYFETAKQQLHVLADLPQEAQVKFLVSSTETIKDAPKLLGRIVESWLAGDMAALSDIISDANAMGGREVYNALLVNRNQIWSKNIKALMATEPGTYFIAVGAAHLAGEDSMIAMLRESGEVVVRQ